MEDEFTALDALFELGMCTYTTQYRDYYFSVTIRVVPEIDQFYNYVFTADTLRESIYLMLDRYLENKECAHISACMWETISDIQLPDEVQLPVIQLNTLEVEIKGLRIMDAYRSPSSKIATFGSFNI